MAPAKVQVITNTISLDNSDYKFVSTGEKVEFDGFLRVYQETRDMENADEDEPSCDSETSVKSNNSIKLKKGSQVFRTVISSQSKYTKPPHAHFRRHPFERTKKRASEDQALWYGFSSSNKGLL